MDNFILLGTCVIEFYIIYDFYNAFLQPKPFFTQKLRQLMIILPLTGYTYYINTFHNSYFNLINAVFIMYIYITLVFISSLRQRILYTLTLCIAFWGCEFLFAILLSIHNTNGKSVDLSDIPWQMLTQKLLTYVICLVLKQYSSKSSAAIDSKVFRYYIIIPIASIGIMLATYYSGFDYAADNHTSMIFCICFLLIQLGNIAIFRASQKYSESLTINAQQKLVISKQAATLNYYMKLSDLTEQRNELLHNTNQYIKTLGLLIEGGKINEAISYIDSLNIKLDALSVREWSKRNILNIVLYEKYSLAKEKDIEMDIYAEPYADFNSVSDIDIINIVANLLDNAIEACEKCEKNRFIKVRIYNNNFNCFTVLKITNSYNGIFNMKNGVLISTKEDNLMHGIGHKSAAISAKKYGGDIQYFTDAEYVTTVAYVNDVINQSYILQA